MAIPISNARFAPLARAVISMNRRHLPIRDRNIVLRRVNLHLRQQLIALRQQMIEILSLIALENRVESRFHDLPCLPFNCPNFPGRSPLTET
jgi:hypothetical protein